MWRRSRGAAARLPWRTHLAQPPRRRASSSANRHAASAAAEDLNLVIFALAQLIRDMGKHGEIALAAAEPSSGAAGEHNLASQGTDLLLSQDARREALQ